MHPVSIEFDFVQPSGPSGAFSTSLASCGLIQVGGEASAPVRLVGDRPVGFARADFTIEIN
jgi:hypothetical protein